MQREHPTFAVCWSPLMGITLAQMVHRRDRHKERDIPARDSGGCGARDEPMVQGGICLVVAQTRLRVNTEDKSGKLAGHKERNSTSLRTLRQHADWRHLRKDAEAAALSRPSEGMTRGRGQWPFNPSCPRALDAPDPVSPASADRSRTQSRLRPI